LSAKSDPDFRARLQIAPSDFVVGMIARLCELKGHDDLIASAPAIVKRNARTKFLLVGGGPWRERLQARVQELRLHDHFVFAGLVSPAEIPHYLGAMDVLAHLSRREGLARALPQALAAGCPVITYDCDGAKEICLPDQTGYLIPPGDLHQLAERILQLAADPALRERLGKQGQQLVKHRFSVEQMVEELYGLYRRLDAQRK
jgi:glycosyltransferase involved in cell wall biosynthesis